MNGSEGEKKQNFGKLRNVTLIADELFFSASSMSGISHVHTQKRSYTPAYTQTNSHVNEYALRNVHGNSRASLIASFMPP